VALDSLAELHHLVADDDIEGGTPGDVERPRVEVDSRGRHPPWALTGVAGWVDAHDQAVLLELAQMVADRGGRHADRLRRIGRGDDVVGGQQVEQTLADRVGESLEDGGIGDGQRPAAGHVPSVGEGAPYLKH